MHTNWTGSISLCNNPFFDNFSIEDSDVFLIGCIEFVERPAEAGCTSTRIGESFHMFGLQSLKSIF